MHYLGWKFPFRHIGVARFALCQRRKARPLGSLGIPMTGRTPQLQPCVLLVAERPYFVRPQQGQGKT